MAFLVPNVCLISAKCWCVNVLYTLTLLFLQEKWLVGESDWPAPVEPVMAETCTSSVIKPAATNGKRANSMEVAKQPGFAILVADWIFSFWNSAKP